MAGPTVDRREALPRKTRQIYAVTHYRDPGASHVGQGRKPRQRPGAATYTRPTMSTASEPTVSRSSQRAERLPGYSTASTGKSGRPARQVRPARAHEAAAGAGLAGRFILGSQYGGAPVAHICTSEPPLLLLNSGTELGQLTYSWAELLARQAQRTALDGFAQLENTVQNEHQGADSASGLEVGCHARTTKNEVRVRNRRFESDSPRSNLIDVDVYVQR